MITVDRERKTLWSQVDGRVRQVVGESCAPDNPDVWWCPYIGLSLVEGYGLFDTKGEAVAKAREYIARERSRLAELEAAL